jgi:hypothetical protein
MAERPDQQRNLPTMMNTVVGRVLHEGAQDPCTLLAPGVRVFKNAIEIFVFQLRQELAHISFDRAPGPDERFHCRVIVRVEGTATTCMPSAPV